jgi:hypothetical protein
MKTRQRFSILMFDDGYSVSVGHNHGWIDVLGDIYISTVSSDRSIKIKEL